jgi:DNA-binding MarR family transcriptional regulator
MPTALTLLQGDGQQFIGEGSIEQLEACVNELCDNSGWTERAAQNFDTIVRHWLEAALGRGRRDGDTVAALRRLLTRTSTALRGGEAWAEPLRQRWSGWIDLADARSLAITYNIPEVSLKKPHRKDALGAIRRGIRKQHELRKELNLSEGYVSIIVRDLEQAGLICITKDGRSNTLSLAPPPPAPPPVPADNAANAAKFSYPRSFLV